MPNYTPRNFAVTGTMANCDGASAGPPLSLPDIHKMLPAGDPALTADMLGTGTLSACYKLVGSAGGNWAAYTWERYSDKHKQAEGRLVVQVDIKLGSKVILSRSISSPSATGLVCFADTDKDSINAAPVNYPAIGVLTSAWEGQFVGPGVCSSPQQALASVSNIKAAFEAGSVVGTNWAATDSAGRAAVQAANQAALTTLASGAEKYLADQVSLTGTNSANAARTVTGAKLALQRYIEFAYPALARSNDGIRNAFAGKGQLYDGAQIQDLLNRASIEEAASNSPTRAIFIADASARIDGVASVINAHQAQIISGKIVDDDIELSSVKLQLQALLGSLR